MGSERSDEDIHGGKHRIGGPTTAIARWQSSRLGYSPHHSKRFLVGFLFPAEIRVTDNVDVDRLTIENSAVKVSRGW